MKKAIYFLALGAMILALGIFMWARPNTFANLIALVVALYILFDGARSLYFYLKVRKKSSKAISNTILSKALLNILISVSALVISYVNREAILNIVVYLIAIDLIAAALIDLADYFLIKKAKMEMLYSSLGVQAALGLVFGALFIIFPQFVGKTGITIIALIVIVAGVIALSYGVHLVMMIKALKNYKKAVETEAEFTEAEPQNEETAK